MACSNTQSFALALPWGTRIPQPFTWYSVCSRCFFSRRHHRSTGGNIHNEFRSPVSRNFARQIVPPRLLICSEVMLPEYFQSLDNGLYLIFFYYHGISSEHIRKVHERLELLRRFLEASTSRPNTASRIAAVISL